MTTLTLQCKGGCGGVFTQDQLAVGVCFDCQVAATVHSVVDTTRRKKKEKKKKKK